MFFYQDIYLNIYSCGKMIWRAIIFQSEATVMFIICKVVPERIYVMFAGVGKVNKQFVPLPYGYAHLIGSPGIL